MLDVMALTTSVPASGQLISSAVGYGNAGQDADSSRLRAITCRDCTVLGVIGSLCLAVGLVLWRWSTRSASSHGRGRGRQPPRQAHGAAQEDGGPAAEDYPPDLEDGGGYGPPGLEDAFAAASQGRGGRMISAGNEGSHGPAEPAPLSRPGTSSWPTVFELPSNHLTFESSQELQLRAPSVEFSYDDEEHGGAHED